MKPQRIKLLSRVTIIFMTAMLLLSFTSCHPQELMKENAEVREMTEQMLDAIIANDYATARALMEHSSTDANFTAFFNKMYSYFKDVEDYTLTMIGVNIKITNGVNRYTAVYRLETSKGDAFDITVGTSSDMEGLYGFHVSDADADTPRYTGTLTTMSGATIFQWVLLIVGMATYAFVIWALVDCCRQKIHQKWLYLLIIILGSVTCLFTVQRSGVNFNFSFLSLLSYSALMIYQNPPDAVQLRLFVPVGAIIYLCLRKRLIVAASGPSPEASGSYEGINSEFIDPAVAPSDISMQNISEEKSTDAQDTQP